VVIKPSFEYAHFFLGELANVTVEDRRGLINKEGKLIISWREK
jgi:hypothetical protein